MIRVDVPGAEEQRSDPGYAVWDRGKESIFLDLSRALSDLQKDGKGISDTSAKGMDLSHFYRLVMSIDVLLESFAPHLIMCFIRRGLR